MFAMRKLKKDNKLFNGNSLEAKIKFGLFKKFDYLYIRMF